ncbi:MAG: NUDIX domain-containing protein [Chloroflexi bacterium]|nr:NUDIX domain-containing protein [Chloroflexota bacterium]
MSKLIYGDRVGKTAVLAPGASAIIFDEAREKVLLTRRTDNGRWCLPGGGMDPGESAAETCVRETLEETGLEVRVTRLVGIYTSSDMIIEYADGNRVQPVAFSFEAEITGGELGLSDETTEFGYFAIEGPGGLDGLDLMEHHLQRILDAAENREATFIR